MTLQRTTVAIALLAGILAVLATPQHASTLDARDSAPFLGGGKTAIAPLPLVADRPVQKNPWLTVTASSSTVDQTDGDPFTTASGNHVEDGIIAHNYLPFGTRVRFPERFGNKVFIVQDRLHESKGYYIADIWMQTREDAVQWGAPILKMEVLES